MRDGTRPADLNVVAVTTRVSFACGCSYDKVTKETGGTQAISLIACNDHKEVRTCVADEAEKVIALRRQ